MSRIQKAFDSVREFVGEVHAETKRIDWPPRQELVESTTMVIISLVLLSMFVGLFDKTVLEVLRFLFHWTR
jgi:preprotein translocase subunit SecE